MKSNKTSLSLLHAYTTVEEALKELLPISKNKLKKNLPKNFLQKAVRAKDTLELSLDIVNYGLINPTYQGAGIEVLYQDDEILVLNKPTKIHSHPLSYLENDNVLSFIRSTFDKDELLLVNISEYDRGLLYRLDYETSGVICYIKKSALFHELRDQFAKTAKRKVYLGVVRGKFHELGKYQHYFTATGEKGHKQKVNSDRGDFLGELEILGVQYNEEKDLSLLSIQLVTGLRHQIRAQLSFLGFPLLGDELYGGEAEERLFLHAYEYMIDTRTRKYELKAPVPVQFTSLFRSL